MAPTARILSQLSKRLPSPPSLRLRPVHSLSPCLHRAAPIRISLSPTIATRAAHSIPRPPGIRHKEPKPSSPAASDPAAPSSESDSENESERPELKGPAFYQLSFTCNPCGHRSHHNISKQAYHHGSTLITCPSCRNRHVISDHLGIFGDKKMTIEDLMREKGQLVKRGSLGEDGDIEFWPEERYAQHDAQRPAGAKD